MTEVHNTICIHMLTLSQSPSHDFCRSAPLVCLCSLVVYKASNMDLDQTAPLGAV